MKPKYNTLEDLINNHLDIHKQNFEKDGEAVNMLIAYTDTESILFPLIFKSEEDKYQILEILKVMFVALGVKRYTVGVEAWRVAWPATMSPEQAEEEYSKYKSQGKSLADHPDRTEILHCTAVSHQEAIAMSYDIDDKTRKLHNPSGIMTNVSGNFAELLPPPNLPEEAVKQAQKIIEQMNLPFHNSQWSFYVRWIYTFT